MPQHNWFAKGEWNATCDICGRVFKSPKLSQDWDNSMRCSQCLDGRHPQDFIQVKPDNQTVPWARPWNDTASIGIGQWINNSGTILPWITGGGPLDWTF